MKSLKRDWIAFVPGMLFLLLLIAGREVMDGFDYQQKESHLFLMVTTLFCGLISLGLYILLNRPRFTDSVSEKTKRQVLLGVCLSAVFLCVIGLVYWRKFLWHQD